MTIATITLEHQGDELAAGARSYIYRMLATAFSYPTDGFCEESGLRRMVAPAVRARAASALRALRADGNVCPVERLPKTPARRLRQHLRSRDRAAVLPPVRRVAPQRPDEADGGTGALLRALRAHRHSRVTIPITCAPSWSSCTTWRSRRPPPLPTPIPFPTCSGRSAISWTGISANGCRECESGCCPLGTCRRSTSSPRASQRNSAGAISPG